MRSSIIVIAVALVVESTYAFAPSIAFKSTISKNTMIQREMFGGSGAPPAEEDPEADKETAAAAKAMGLSVEEFNLAGKIREQMIQDVAAIRAQGGSESGGVTVVVDGNQPAGYLKINVNDTGKALGKAGLEKAVLAALKEATEEGKKGFGDAMKEMSENISKGLSGMEDMKRPS
mmetsp:Transcript_45651/g.53445  ORF Transcript_45651/g.53445 Transcript_45651/m.53445 type:complete len:175 (-) Transcript_45651:180-704(-)|eukprot:CAMPEP_0194368402 /NCGR_PEP_ID=MMETSP0174-20130528/16681_1 /TAXON_ID=216777 /ORGANISM="Proboscia alata, Strain PI-D3" /LENGTH=174 /DNA_ID=CAMNT_0039144789 /DNA_START=69 /DNA_END=593 /DNA_ORIENTATION=-